MAFLNQSSRGVGVALAAALTLLCAPAAGQVLTQDQALALAFPDNDAVERRTAYLDDTQLERLQELAGSQVEIGSTVVPYYVASKGGRALGVAYFDVHRVRTLDEVLMIVVGTEGRIRRIETVSFREPPEYKAPAGWLDLFEGRALTPELSLKGDIPVMTGATLTAGSVTDAARRVLALHAVIAPLRGGGGANR